MSTHNLLLKGYEALSRNRRKLMRELASTEGRMSRRSLPGDPNYSIGSHGNKHSGAPLHRSCAANAARVTQHFRLKVKLSSCAMLFQRARPGESAALQRVTQDSFKGLLGSHLPSPKNFINERRSVVCHSGLGFWLTWEGASAPTSTTTTPG